MGSPNEVVDIPPTVMDGHEKAESVSPSMEDLYIDPVKERKMMLKFDVSWCV